ncbi:MAG: hypothetical protein CBC84_000710 [Pelagibacteraceae bacterium TMED124]|nr:MAG: hypothetical protein CBC84_000710 [Pelagibacteraceae bacterium TMED124]|tara:strand:+ start:3034 stop:3894 length:861 start_codon:yes stop_codon:yes gene_type:complete
MKTHFLKSPAKINLFLKVGKRIKRKKHHNIQSLIFLTSLHDEILIKKIKKNKDIVKFTGRFSNNIMRVNNTVSKSMYLLRKKKLIDNKTKYQITIKKNIPVFSGLGGGSSNAATIIKHFLKKRKISKYNTNFFSKYLGSDFRIFLKSKKIFQENLLKVEEFNGNYNFYFLIVFPNLKSSTKEVYSKFKEHETFHKKHQYKKISKSEFVQKVRLEINSLENTVIYKFPILRNLLEKMELIKNCQFSRITGSGSACFGLFLNKKDVTLALKSIKRSFPAFWCVVSKTI